VQAKQEPEAEGEGELAPKKQKISLFRRAAEPEV
jgi:hypothetical protein